MTKPVKTDTLGLLAEALAREAALPRCPHIIDSDDGLTVSADVCNKVANEVIFLCKKKKKSSGTLTN